VLEIDVEGDIDRLPLQSGSLIVGLHDHENVDVGVRMRIAPGDRSKQSKVDEVRSETGADPSNEIGDGLAPASIEGRHDVDRLHDGNMLQSERAGLAGHFFKPAC